MKKSESSPRHAGRSQPDFVDMCVDHIVVNVECGERNRQLEPSRAGAAGVHVQHAFTRLDTRLVGMSGDDDIEFCQDMVRHGRVASVPLSASWKERRGPRHLARLCFAKREETIRLALERMAAWRNTLENA